MSQKANKFTHQYFLYGFGLGLAAGGMTLVIMASLFYGVWGAGIAVIALLGLYQSVCLVTGRFFAPNESQDIVAAVPRSEFRWLGFFAAVGLVVGVEILVAAINAG